MPTASERFLAHLARRSFLNLWSYPHPFRDQGAAARGGEGAELCDLLVVFGSNLIIFSDKSCEWRKSSSVEKAWLRWYRRAIQRSAEQIWGAERWMALFPDRVFADRACRARLPVELPERQKQRVLRVLVARDPSGMRREDLGGSGRLMLDVQLVGADNSGAEGEARPGVVGRIRADRGFVHVFDETALELVMGAVDTTPDFIAYLEAKEQCIASGRLRGSVGEEELLGRYLSNVDAEGRHVFALPDGEAPAVVGGGHWSGLTDRVEYRNKLLLDEHSRNWDRMIEWIAHHALAGTLEHGSEMGVREHERVLRVLASETRLQRRVLVKALEGVMERATDGRRYIRTMYPRSPGEPHYVFLAWGAPQRHRSSQDLEAYRAVRREWLGDYCYCLAALGEAVGSVVGIATEELEAEERSYDMAYASSEDVTDEARAEAKEVADREGWFQRLARTDVWEDEYPATLPGSQGRPSETYGRVGRNEPCPCGSGRKYKRCHGA